MQTAPSPEATAILSQTRSHYTSCHYLCMEEVSLEVHLIVKVLPRLPPVSNAWYYAHLEVGTHDTVIVGTLDVCLIVAW